MKVTHEVLGALADALGWLVFGAVFAYAVAVFAVASMYPNSGSAFITPCYRASTPSYRNGRRCHYGWRSTANLSSTHDCSYSGSYSVGVLLPLRL
jgi:hypothetical protein